MESPAPSIKVENWLRGEPLTSFEPGKVCIVEFWATWCGPCVDGMPHLIQLQEKYKDNGVEIVGVAASEDAPTADEARSTLDAWLTEKFPNLNYRIAFDSTGEMDKLWMEPSFSYGVPTSFVVDRDGHIAFIGHPTQLDEVLPKVLNGSWRISDQAKSADTERIAEGETIAREQALTKPIYDKLRPAMEAEDWKTALSAIEEGLALIPDKLNFRVSHVNLLLHRMRDMQAGLPVMRQFVRDAIDRKSEGWMYWALYQLFAPGFDYSGFPSAERFAMGEELSKHIVALPQGGGSKFLSYPVVAQYYHQIGNKDRAIELVEQTLKALEGPEPISDDLKQHLLPELLQALANYKGEKVCYGALCVAPQEDSPKR
ncbi:TlpA disulfide reductase family protein [Mesorhizobium sp.]|uniref:TlpA disulfide reductase family protein n=1 Tax=Mesorhizobium sp. TaxID=1871066 RepID=UPI000FE36DF7|nr:TlpA disulfide reductase family protein [Mesorhizobium sp.]RWG77862.1 MAG: TlpA family protein disulfide reductase [Mesorhizobium sp.]RWK14687.1 MAG: TlpA family protein disulfide reductase [Mesorhizobium sp.]RWL39874.1 MAG: TlpA family protein disulfide reductase [Mesorhizobium sp.]TIP15331.1 MAG: redoxin domain-containing protein [Mesorhizobium sp.]TIQ02969.1 MAG: redoxin domain-containing protein [Mesorhizobium sp.]